MIDPQLLALEVRLEPRLFVAAEVGDVDAVPLDADDVDEVVPGPGDDLPLEVVAEGPVAQHLEEGVVVDVLAHVVQVVVLPARAHALLRVDGAPVFVI